MSNRCHDIDLEYTFSMPLYLDKECDIGYFYVKDKESSLRASYLISIAPYSPIILSELVLRSTPPSFLALKVVIVGAQEIGPMLAFADAHRRACGSVPWIALVKLINERERKELLKAGFDDVIIIDLMGAGDASDCIDRLRTRYRNGCQSSAIIKQ